MLVKFIHEFDEWLKCWFCRLIKRCVWIPYGDIGYKNVKVRRITAILTNRPICRSCFNIKADQVENRL